MSMVETEEDKDEVTGDKPWWSEMVKEVTLTGLATVFMTEDSIRKYLKDKKLPKELIALLLESASKKKEDLFEKFASEFGNLLKKVDVTKEMSKFLETHKVHVKATLSFENKNKSKASEEEEES
jgi:hypothetical protein